LPASAAGDEMCAPRRTGLDKLLLDAAAAAGAEIREGLLVTDGMRHGMARDCP
jgi:hypothetical protein